MNNPLSQTDISSTQSWLQGLIASTQAFFASVGVAKGLIIVFIIYIIAHQGTNLIRMLVTFFAVFMLLGWVISNQAGIVSWCHSVAAQVPHMLWSAQQFVTKP